MSDPAPSSTTRPPGRKPSHRLDEPQSARNGSAFLLLGLGGLLGVYLRSR